jgi:hypothetical protein
MPAGARGKNEESAGANGLYAFRASRSAAPVPRLKPRTTPCAARR